VLISALAFDLVAEVQRSGGLGPPSPSPAVAAGAILAVIADTMIPEAFERTGLYTRLLATLGFIGHAGG